MKLSRRVWISTGILSIVVLGVTTVLAQNPTLPNDHLTGLWRLNLAKSKFDPADMAPKSDQARVTVTTAGVKVQTDGVNAQGKPTHSEYMAKFDGKDYPWTGTVDGKPNTDQDAVSWKQIDDWTYDVTNKLKGKVTSTMHIVISKDGKSGTGTITGTGPQGQAVKHTAVYEK
jgi:hypothetical protein